MCSSGANKQNNMYANEQYLDSGPYTWMFLMIYYIK